MVVKENSFYLKHLLALLASAILLWLVFDFTSLDIIISSFFYDFQNKLWPYKSEPFILFVYFSSKNLLVWSALLLLLALGASFFYKPLAAYRKTALFLLITLAIVPGEIASLKVLLPKSRPEQIIFFNGSFPHTYLFDFLWGEENAHNWPSGHAAGGASLLSLYFISFSFTRKVQYFLLAFGLCYWFIMGWIQVMRGQHFFSHNLWSLWFAWLTILILYYFFSGSYKKRTTTK